MAHEVESMFYAGEMPWHGLGKQMPNELTCVEALAHAGLDWEVEMARMYTTDGLVDGWRACRRSSDARILGVVSDTWEPVQNYSLALVGDAIAGMDNALCNTAGSLRNGQWVWFLLKLRKELRVANDPSPIEQYLLLSNRHDGSMALRLMFTPVRVVCANTARMAIEGAQQQVAVRHTTNVDANLRAAAEAVKASVDYYQRFEEIANRMATTKYSSQQMGILTEQLYPKTDEEKVADAAAEAARKANFSPDDAAQLMRDMKAFSSQKLQADLNDYARATNDALSAPTERVQAKREQLMTLFEQGTGFGPDMKGTAWAAYQAVSEHTDHGRDFSDSKNHTANENRFNNLLFGEGAKLQQRAAEVISKQTGISL